MYKVSSAQMGGDYGDSYVHYCIPKHNTCKASYVLTVYISPVMEERSFSLRAVFMLMKQRVSQMGGTCSLGDVNRERI